MLLVDLILAKLNVSVIVKSFFMKRQEIKYNDNSEKYECIKYND